MDGRTKGRMERWSAAVGAPSCWAAVLVGALLLTLGGGAPIWAQTNDECLMCHADEGATGARDGRELRVHVDPAGFAASVHADMACVDCHEDLAGAELPHDEDTARVDCAGCHDEAATVLAAGPHRRLTKAGAPASACVSCHSAHAILASSAAASPIGVARLGELCGSCHTTASGEVEASVHGHAARGGVAAASCSDCHRGHDVVVPRADVAQVATCGACHPRQGAEHARSLHGRAAQQGDPLAPACVTCHDSHTIRSRRDPASPTATVNVPLLCGRCHHEGSEVSLQHDIPQDRILENYSESIHGEGLFKKGLTVTAVCTSCHTSHLILEHADPQSSINRANVAATCMTCHARIEEVHTKVIEGRLWEEKPHEIPSCVECHSPHKIRRVGGQERGATNALCFKCHGNRSLTVTRDGVQKSLYVDPDEFALHSHGEKACAQCHTEVNPSLERPCQALSLPVTVDCGICHADQVEQHRNSIHGQLLAKGDNDAPTCLDCHTHHSTPTKRLPTSPTYPRNVPALCARCHRTGEVAALRIGDKAPEIVRRYEESIHGRGLVEAGLVVSATCTNCHTAHSPQPPEVESSSVNPNNIAATCGTCHNGIEETFKTSVHWPGNTTTDKKLPTCEACHTSHTIARTDGEGFRTTMMNQCGRCHIGEAETFFDTYHGKVSRLGSEGAAKCYDCHGTHDILPVDNPDSHLSRGKVVETCAKCHAGAHRKFAGYLTHATHHDPDKYPYLFYAFWFMTTLLVGTLSFFALHTMAWLFRLWRSRGQWQRHEHTEGMRFYRRFTAAQRTTHGVMLVSFFTLALTGMALKFSYMGWASILSNLLGGFHTMGVLHRVGAVVLVAVFVFHLSRVVIFKQESGRSWIRYIFGPNTMMFTWRDVKEFYGSMKWFLGRGERPQYGRFTYWEKFDYFAVFWGVFIIGGTGLLLWFPEAFTRILPGWSVNVATIIHSDEALLAVAFIFTIHFFNTHFRPDKFPMDPVIFTGRVPLDELKQDKPEEYEAFVAGKTPEEIERALVEPIPRVAEKAFRIFGFIALGIGLSLIGLIIYAMLFAYL